jgi:hypothetical protein
VGNSLLARQVTPTALLQRLQQEEKRLELVESSFQATYDFCTPMQQQLLLAVSLFPASFGTLRQFQLFVSDR